MTSSKLMLAAVLSVALVAPGLAQDMLCWFPPGSDGPACKAMTDALAKESGIAVKPRVGISYPEILKALSEDKPQLAYVGSFVSAIISAQDLGVALVQKIDGKELYSGVMIFPKGGDPQSILKTEPAKIAFAKSTSSGESAAKAATAGAAAMPVKDHMAAANAVKTGNAKAGFVKNVWWAGNKDKFPELEAYLVPGVSEAKNPDNILWASKAVSAAQRSALTSAAKAASAGFGAREMRVFDVKLLGFSLELMKKGGIDPKTYSW